ncbi:MAG: hypothetical protein QM778_19785 [Myxococcales bacterium]
MSLEQSTELAAGARRRIVALPARIEAPVALIMREAEQREALTDHLGRRRVVSFPSLAHFCTDEQRRQPWLGIVVGYSCAWDAQLVRFVPHPSCITLYQVPEEGHGWPEDVVRIGELDRLDAWLLDLAEPIPGWKKALEEARKKPRKPKPRVVVPRVVTPRIEAARVEGAQLSLPMAAAVAPAPSVAEQIGSFSHRAKGATGATRTPKVITKRIVREPAPTRPARARGAAPARTKMLASAAPASTRRPHITLSAKDLAAASRAGAHLPKELVRLASEIGFARAQELLSGLQQNARAIMRVGR